MPGRRASAASRSNSTGQLHRAALDRAPRGRRDRRAARRPRPRPRGAAWGGAGGRARAPAAPRARTAWSCSRRRRAAARAPCRRCRCARYSTSTGTSLASRRRFRMSMPYGPAASDRGSPAPGRCRCAASTSAAAPPPGRLDAAARAGWPRSRAALLIVLDEQDPRQPACSQPQVRSGWQVVGRRAVLVAAARLEAGDGDRRASRADSTSGSMQPSRGLAESVVVRRTVRVGNPDSPSSTRLVTSGSGIVNAPVSSTTQSTWLPTRPWPLTFERDLDLGRAGRAAARVQVERQRHAALDLDRDRRHHQRLDAPASSSTPSPRTAHAGAGGEAGWGRVPVKL